METSAPGNRHLYTISEVACPDSCNQPESEKGCHFRIGPDRFTCTKCQLRIWRHFMGYELTPTDLQDMLHGEKVTSSEKTLIWKKDGKETAIRGRLVLTEEYKVRIAPKLKSKQPTDEACPKCNAGKLQLITSIDGSKWYGCSGFPQCRFTKAFIPHTFKTAPVKKEGEHAEDSGKTTRPGAHNGETSGGQSQPIAHGIKRIKKSLPREDRSLEKAKAPAANDSDFAVPLNTQKTATPSLPSCDNAETAEASGHDRFQRIPKFILRMLKSDRRPSIKSSDTPSLK